MRKKHEKAQKTINYADRFFPVQNIIFVQNLSGWSSVWLTTPPKGVINNFTRTFLLAPADEKAFSDLKNNLKIFWITKSWKIWHTYFSKTLNSTDFHEIQIWQKFFWLETLSQIQTLSCFYLFLFHSNFELEIPR